MTALLAVPMALRTPAQQRRIMELSDEVDAEAHPKRGKRKKRRKRRTPRSSSRSPRGRAKRRQRQWYLYGWLPWLRCISRFVRAGQSCLASWTVRTRMKVFRSLLVVSGCGICSAGFYWYCTSRCVPSCFRQASDARHHDRYEPEGQLCVAWRRGSFPWS